MLKMLLNLNRIGALRQRALAIGVTLSMCVSVGGYPLVVHAAEPKTIYLFDPDANQSSDRFRV